MTDKKKVKVEGFDLDNYSVLASSDGVWMELMDPVTETPIINNNNEPVRIKVVGEDSPSFRAKEREFMNRRLAKNKLKIGSAEQLESESVETLVACTVAWEGFIRGGTPWEFSKDNARLLYSDDKWRWIREQVDKFIGERRNFLQATKTN